MTYASRRRGIALAVSLAACFATTASAQASTVTAPEAVDRSCIESKRTDAAVATQTVTVPGVSAVTARLSDAGGNWDLAVVDESGRVVAGSAYADGDEVAQGFAIEPGALHVQACRRSGSDPTAELEIETIELTEPAPRLQMVRVATPDEDSAERLSALGFDLTEHGGAGFVDVVLHGPVEGALLNDEGYDFEVLIPDLASQSVADRSVDRRMAARGNASGLPSGRTDTYRELADYSEEMQKLAEKNPKLVNYFTLKNETYEGRPVEAIEVGPAVDRSDGRPTFLITGVHHAREWPSAESTIEFAYELIKGYKNGNKRTTRLLKRVRVVFVPVVNPDGFNLSRSAGAALGASGGRDAPAGDETANLVIESEYHRKNCRFLQDTGMEGGDCNQQPDNGISHFGVDPNRNYGGFWGGPGAATGEEAPFFDTAQDYRGPGPFSEPETRNIRELVSKRQVVTLITNHTFSNLVLRPPGLQAAGKPRDDKLLTRLGNAMAAENGYKSQRGFQLYDTSGTTEDWSYNATGGLGYTFEIGPDAFHPSYDVVADEYRGNTEAADGEGGNSAAYMKALKSSAKTKRHSLIQGEAPKGFFLTLKKRFKTPTSPVLNADGEEGKVLLLPEKLKSKLEVGKRGRFAWHVNPSTRPLVDPRVKRLEPRPGKPSDPVEFSGSPGPSAIICGDADTEDEMCWNDHAFKVKGGEGIDNGSATVKISWPEPATDWDLKVFVDSDGDGSSEGEKKIVGSSLQGTTTEESTTIARPGLKPGDYVARVINFSALSPYDGRVSFGKTQASTIETGFEKYTLACRAKKSGRVLSRQKVQVDRGERVSVDLTKTCVN
ncbi:MAG: M14 family zinc carboxypeptidase [Solirubrobacterales bacterium]